MPVARQESIETDAATDAEKKKARARLKKRYSPKAIVDALVEFKVDARFEISQLVKLVKSRRSSRAVRLKALEKLQELRYSVDDSRLSSRVYKRLDMGEKARAEQKLPPDMLEEAEEALKRTDVPQIRFSGSDGNIANS